MQGVAEAGVDVPRATRVRIRRQAVHLHHEVVVERILRRSVGAVHLAAVEGDVVAEMLEEQAEGAVEVIAVAAPRVAGDAQQRGFAPDGAALAHVDPRRLVRHVLDLRCVQTMQGLDRGRLAVEPQPSQVGVDVGVGDHSTTANARTGKVPMPLTFGGTAKKRNCSAGELVEAGQVLDDQDACRQQPVWAGAFAAAVVDVDRVDAGQDGTAVDQRVDALPAVRNGCSARRTARCASGGPSRWRRARRGRRRRGQRARRVRCSGPASGDADAGHVGDVVDRQAGRS